jgi:hypothetical protein
MTEDEAVNRAIVVLKPDGAASELETQLACLWRAASLTMIAQTRDAFQEAHISTFWPEYDDEKHPISLGFQRRYLLGREMWAVLLEGPDAAERSSLIKQALRREKATGIFGNLIHSTAGTWEYWRHLRVLFPDFWDKGHPPVREMLIKGMRQLPGLDLEELSTTSEELASVVYGLADCLIKGEPVKIDPVALADDATWSVFLRFEAETTLDSIASALRRGMAISLRDAIVFGLEAAGSGGVVLAYGSRALADRMAASLVGLGLAGIDVQRGSNIQ